MGGGCCICDCGFCCIFDFCSDHGCSYHPREKVTVDHSKIIADELAAMKEKAREDGRKIGDEAFQNVNASMSNFINELKKINNHAYGGKKLNIKIDAIERKIDELRNEVTNFVGKELDKRLVLTDGELSVILAEHDDSKRKKNFDAFYQRIHKQAVNDLSEKVREVTVHIFALIDTDIRSRLKEVEQSTQDALTEYNKIIKKKEQFDKSLSEDLVGYMYSEEISNIMLDELDSSVGK